MNREQLEEQRELHEAHRGEIHDHLGRPVFCCVGCEQAGELLDEIDRLARELETMREVAQSNRRHVEFLSRELERIHSPAGGSHEAGIEITSIAGVEPTP